MPLNRFKTSPQDQSDEGLPIARYVRKDPSLAAAISKNTAALLPASTEADGSVSLRHVNPHIFRSALARRAKRNADNESFLRLLPDLKLAAQILISSILSPKNMMDTELIYQLPKNVFGPNLSAALSSVLKTHFTEETKIDSTLSEMLHEALVTKGSYPVVVIPENALDAFINQDRVFSTEAYAKRIEPLLASHLDADRRLKPIGYLGDPKAQSNQKVGSVRLALESEHSARTTVGYSQHVTLAAEASQMERMRPIDAYSAQCDLVSVTDNPLAFSLSRLNDKIEARARQALYEKSMGASVSLENFRPVELASRGLSDQAINQMLTPNRHNRQENVAMMPSSQDMRRKSIGAPLVMRLPSEAVVPVHVPGDLKKHVGYFIMLDEKGYPVDVSDGDQYGMTNASGGNMGYNTSLTSNIVRRVEHNLGADGGGFDIANDEHVRAAAQVYSDMVQRDLVARVRNGAYGKDVSLADNEDLYRIMLARTLAGKYTQLLYLPTEYLTYIAFDYGADGLGRTILDDQAMINTMRVTLMFVDVMASMRNSIPLTKVSINIPEKDPNPRKTLVKAMDHALRTRAIQLPSGIGNTSDIVRTVNNAGYVWEVTGENKGIPDLKFDISEKSTQYPRPDTELRDNLKAQSAMGFYLSPETVSRSADPEFATTAMHNNILLAKRVMVMQDEFVPQVSAHLRKYTQAHQGLMEEIRKHLEENFDEILLKWEDFPEMSDLQDVKEESKKKYVIYRALRQLIEEFSVTLPRPTVDTLENQTEDLRKFSDMVDMAMDGYLSDMTFTEGTAGEVAQQKDTLRGLIKSMLFRAYMAKTGIMPELQNLTIKTDDGDPMNEFLKESTEHSIGLTRAATRAWALLQPVAQAADNDLQKLGAKTDAAPGSTELSSAGAGGGGGFGGFGGEGGDDFGMGGLGGADDMGMGELGSGDALGGGEDTGSDPLADNSPTGGGEDDPLGGFEQP